MAGARQREMAARQEAGGVEPRDLPTDRPSAVSETVGTSHGRTSTHNNRSCPMGRAGRVRPSAPEAALDRDRHVAFRLSLREALGDLVGAQACRPFVVRPAWSPAGLIRNREAPVAAPELACRHELEQIASADPPLDVDGLHGVDHRRHCRADAGRAARVGVLRAALPTRDPPAHRPLPVHAPARQPVAPRAGRRAAIMICTDEKRLARRSSTMRLSKPWRSFLGDQGSRTGRRDGQRRDAQRGVG